MKAKLKIVGKTIIGEATLRDDGWIHFESDDGSFVGNFRREVLAPVEVIE